MAFVCTRFSIIRAGTTTGTVTTGFGITPMMTVRGLYISRWPMRFAGKKDFDFYKENVQ